MFKNKKILYGIIGLLVLILIISIPILVNNISKTNLLKEYNLDGLSIEELVVHLDKNGNKYNDIKASINGEHLIIIKNDKSYEFALPKNKFYVSIAPYINETHPCKYHNFITCRSELKNEDFYVKVIDKNNNTIFESNVNSYYNGFSGLWLPRNMEGFIEIRYFDKSVITQISTYKDSNTCLTTPLQLR